MKKITLNNDKYQFENNSQIEEELTLKELIKKINSSPKFFEEYEISEEIIISLVEDPSFVGKDYLIPVFNCSQNLVKILLEKEFLKISDLQYLTLNTYFNFDKDFITEYQDHLNWNKIILRKANVTGLVSFNVLEKKKINELNLWDLASSFQLEKKFIKRNRQLLNWGIISITNDFKEEELSDYPELINYKVDIDLGMKKYFKKVIKEVEETSLNEDGFLAFDNVKPIDNELTDNFHRLRKFLLEKQKDPNADTKEIIEKMAAIRKEKFKDITPHFVGKQPKPEVNIEYINNKEEFMNINGITYSTEEDLRNVKSSNGISYNEYLAKSKEVPETPNMVKFEDDVYEITKPETTITEEIIEDSKILSHNILSHTFSQKFTIPVGNTDPELAKQALAELINNCQQDVKFDEDKGELILDGKTKIPYQKDIWFPSLESETSKVELITDTPTIPLTDVFVPVKEEKKTSTIGKFFNKIKNIFNGK
jgi:hypothetical protein